MRNWLCIISLLLIASNAASAQTPVQLAPVPAQQFLSNTGVPLASGCVYTFISGTSTPLAAYTDGTGSTQSSNPIILDAGGFASGQNGTGGLWLSNASYRLQIWSYGSGAVGVNCGNGVLQRQLDNISAYTIINQAQNIFLAGAASDPSGTAGELAYRTDIPCFRGFTTFWDCFVELTLTQTLLNKTLASPAFTGAATGLVATSPTLNSPTLNGITVGGVSIASGSPTNFTTFTNGAAGTTVNQLAKLVPLGVGAVAVNTAITDVGGIEGIVVAGAGTTGINLLQYRGLSTCVFDGSTTVLDYVQISSTVAGNCHDTGSTTYPITGGQVIGRSLSTSVGAGSYLIDLYGPEIRPPGLSTVVNLTAQGANITSTPILTPSGNGFYRFSCYVVVTQAATVSSTSPNCNALYTDADSSVSETILLTTNSSSNTVGAITAPVPPASFYAKSGVAISYSTTGYATSGATSMQYAVHIRLEGPL